MTVAQDDPQGSWWLQMRRGLEKGCIRHQGHHNVSPSGFPNRHHYGWIFWGFLAFAVYGSLVPLDYRNLTIGEALERYRIAWLVPIRIESRSDWMSNILLFIPLGFLLSGWLAVDRDRIRGIGALIAVPVASAALSAAIEFAQVYLPSRTVSARDVVAETIGGAVGGFLWVAVGPWLTRTSRAHVAGKNDLAAWLLPAYLLVLVLSHVMPMDLTISPVDLYHKYTGGMIRVVPFADGFTEPLTMIRRSSNEMTLFLVAGLLLGPATSWRARKSWIVLAQGLAIATFIEFLQVFVASRSFDSTDIVIGGFAVYLGWSMSRRTSGTPGRAQLACFATWFGLAAVASWSPFNFGGDLGTWAAKASTVTILPFADYHRDTVWNAADQIILKSSIFLYLGMMIGPWSLRPWLGAIGLSVLFEAGQLALPGREPSITDVLVELFGTMVGSLASKTAPGRSTHDAAETQRSPLSGLQIQDVP